MPKRITLNVVLDWANKNASFVKPNIRELNLDLKRIRKRESNMFKVAENQLVKVEQIDMLGDLWNAELYVATLKNGKTKKIWVFSNGWRTRTGTSLKELLNWMIVWNEAEKMITSREMEDSELADEIQMDVFHKLKITNIKTANLIGASQMTMKPRQQRIYKERRELLQKQKAEKRKREKAKKKK